MMKGLSQRGRLLESEMVVLVDRIREIYRDDAKFKDLNAWPATRDWLAANVTNLAVKAHILK